MDLGDNVKQKINSETPTILSLYERRDYNQALALLDQQIIKNNDDLDAIIRKTYLLFERGDIQAAIQFIKDKIKTSSRQSILFTVLGLIYFFIGNQENSIECLKSSQKKSSKHETTIALLRKACLNYQQPENVNDDDEEDNSSEVLKASLQDISNGLAITNIYISHTLAYLLKGKIYQKEQNIVKAIECYNDILTIDKKNIYCMYLQAKCNIDKNDFSSAKLLLTKILEIFPDHKLSLELQASTFFTEKNFSNLENVLNTLISKHADSHEGFYYNSYVSFFKADYKTALIQIERCLQLKSDYIAGIKLKTKILIAMSKYEEATKLIDNSFKKQLPMNSKIFLARIQFNQSSYKQYLQSMSHGRPKAETKSPR